MLIQLRRAIIRSINASGLATTEADGNVTSIGHQDDPAMRRSAIVTALKAVAYTCGDISQEEFMEMAAEAYQLKIDEEV
jgi:hypothetical protein